MQLKLVRNNGEIGYTQGKLYINDEFFCDTLEDEQRREKIPAITAIPKGHYKVIIDVSNRFKRRMPLLLNVPNFSGVRIHNGNTAKHTEGCILVGDYYNKGYITNSRVTFAKLMKVLEKAVKEKEVITIEIV